MEDKASLGLDGCLNERHSAFLKSSSHREVFLCIGKVRKDSTLKIFEDVMKVLVLLDYLSNEYGECVRT